MIIATYDTFISWYVVGFFAGVGWGFVSHDYLKNFLNRKPAQDESRPYDHERDAWFDTSS